MSNYFVGAAARRRMFKIHLIRRNQTNHLHAKISKKKTGFLNASFHARLRLFEKYIFQYLLGLKLYAMYVCVVV